MVEDLRMSQLAIGNKVVDKFGYEAEVIDSKSRSVKLKYEFSTCLIQYRYKHTTLKECGLTKI